MFPARSKGSPRLPFGQRCYAPMMDERRCPNPFVPGWGRTPPYLAGRREEQRKLLDLFAYLEHGEVAPRGAVLSGPRGNGKTALLRWFHREIDLSDGPCDVVWLTPSELGDLDQLATSLVPPSRFKALLPDTLSLSVGIGRFGWQLDGRDRSLTLLLAARCKRRPLVLLLDEAHTLPLREGQALLNASQAVSAEAPFLLVMAGTPGLQRHLNDMSATFWSRGEKMGIGRLDPDSSAHALTRPLAAAKRPIAFDADALAHVVDASQRYPYFLQLWGSELWSAAQATHRLRIDDALVARADAGFRRQRSAYYEDRREELERSDLLPLAASVARAFADRETLRSHELNAVIAESSDVEETGDVLQRREELAATGFIWKPPEAEDAWQPGIPSLMRYIFAHAPGSNSS